MKSIFFFAGILFMMSAWAQNSKINNDESELIKINYQFIRNFLNNDTIAHSRIIHPNQFLFIGKDGQFLDRGAYMNNWAHGYNKELTPEFELVEEQVRVFGDMALIVAKTRDVSLRDGK